MVIRAKEPPVSRRNRHERRAGAAKQQKSKKASAGRSKPALLPLREDMQTEPDLGDRMNTQLRMPKSLVEPLESERVRRGLRSRNEVIVAILTKELLP